jgi:hypothetical protein
VCQEPCASRGFARLPWRGPRHSLYTATPATQLPRASPNPPPDVGFFESLNEALDKAAAEGGRDGAKMGKGAEASGQGHLWAEWHKMRPEQRVRLLEGMLKVRGRPQGVGTAAWGARGPTRRAALAALAPGARLQARNPELGPP